MARVTIQAQPGPLEVDLARTAIVMIDMQRDFLEPGGFGETLGNDVSLLAQAIAPAQALLAAARKLGVLIVHTREGHRPDLSDAPPAKVERGSPSLRIGAPGPLGRILIRGEKGHDIIFDRVLGIPERMLPKPLDVAFAALGNNAAAPLLASELATYPNYPAALHDARRLVDLHGDDFWGESLYGAWLGALRGLSVANGDPTDAPGLPAVMQTEPWARRVISSQLASWAELRHDTLLYAKQSYTAVPTCDFPDAYVDPYPEAWAGIVRLAQLGQQLAPALPANTGTDLGPYFASVESVATTLGAMAQEERAGQPLTADQLAFINQAVDEVLMSGGCAQTLVPTGWYTQLFLNQKDAQLTDPTIADVHTDPADGEILHVATGLPRLMYLTVDGCNGARAYAGVVSSYFERTTSNLQRLTDVDWSTEVMATPPPSDVPWVSDLVAN